MKILTNKTLRKNLATLAITVFAAAVIFVQPQLFAQQTQQNAPQQQISVARQPVTIIPLGARIHVLSNRVDLNFNGTQDAGDSAAAWTVLDAASLRPVSFYRFPWEGVNAARPSVDTATKTLYIARRGRVSSFNMETQQLLKDTVAPFGASAVTFIPELQTLLLSVPNPDFVSPGSVLVFSAAINATIASIQAGANVQRTLGFASSRGEFGVAILSEGNFGRPNSTVQLVTVNALTGATTSSTKLTVGDTGNHLLQRGDSLFVTSNGSHEVHIIDIPQKKIVRTIRVGTSGSNGPREAAASDDVLYVTTYNSEVRRFRISTGAPITPILQPQGKPEGLALAGNRLFVANAFLERSFTSATTVAVFDLMTVSVRTSSVNPTLQATLHLSPNPVVNEAQFVMSAQTASELAGATVTLMNARGERVAQLNATREGPTLRAEFSAAVLNVSAGAYFLHVRTQSGSQTMPVVITR